MKDKIQVRIKKLPGGYLSGLSIEIEGKEFKYFPTLGENPKISKTEKEAIKEAERLKDIIV